MNVNHKLYRHMPNANLCSTQVCTTCGRRFTLLFYLPLHEGVTAVQQRFLGHKKLNAKSSLR
jgi:hypothetical protein